MIDRSRQTQHTSLSLFVNATRASYAMVFRYSISALFSVLHVYVNTDKTRCWVWHLTFFLSFFAVLFRLLILFFTSVNMTAMCRQVPILKSMMCLFMVNFDPLLLYLSRERDVNPLLKSFCEFKRLKEYVYVKGDILNFCSISSPDICYNVGESVIIGP